MVQAAEGGRAQIKQELMAMADEMWTHWDEAEVTLDEPEQGYLAKRFIPEDNIAIALITYRCAGLTEEIWDKWA